jgi:hypothetical protein
MTPLVHQDRLLHAPNLILSQHLLDMQYVLQALQRGEVMHPKVTVTRMSLISGNSAKRALSL